MRMQQVRILKTLKMKMVIQVQQHLFRLLKIQILLLRLERRV